MRLFTSWTGLQGVALAAAVGVMGWGTGGCAGSGAGRRMITIHPGEAPLPRGTRGLIQGLGPCYRAALRKNPGLEGELTLTAAFTEGGSVKSFTTDSELPPGLKACLRDRVARWRLPAAALVRKLGPVKVSFAPVPEKSAAHAASPRRRRPGFVDTLIWPEDMPRATLSGDKTVGARIRKIIRERVANLRYCYNRELIRQPGYRALAKVSFRINPLGLPYLVRVRPDRPGSLNQQMISCLKQKVVEWNFFSLPVDVRYGPFVIRFSRRKAQ